MDTIDFTSLKRLADSVERDDLFDDVGFERVVVMDNEEDPYVVLEFEGGMITGVGFSDGIGDFSAEELGVLVSGLVLEGMRN